MSADTATVEHPGLARLPAPLQHAEWWVSFVDEWAQVHEESRRQAQMYSDRAAVIQRELAEADAAAREHTRRGEPVPPPPDYRAESTQMSLWARQLHLARTELAKRQKALLKEHAREIDAAFAQEWQTRVEDQVAPVLAQVTKKLTSVLEEAVRLRRALLNVRVIAGEEEWQRPIGRQLLTVVDLLREVRAVVGGPEIEADPGRAPWRPNFTPVAPPPARPRPTVTETPREVPWAPSPYASRVTAQLAEIRERQATRRR